MNDSTTISKRKSSIPRRKVPVSLRYYTKTMKALHTSEDTKNDTGLIKFVSRLLQKRLKIGIAAKEPE